MKRDEEVVSHSWEAEVTAIKTVCPQPPSGREGAFPEGPFPEGEGVLPRSIQEIVNVGISTRRVIKLIAIFVTIVAIEAVLLVQIPDYSTLRIYQAPENRTLVKP